MCSAEQKGTKKQILNVRQMIEKAREFNVPLVMSFLDYAKEFDSVKWGYARNGRPRQSHEIVREE